ncbi:hypothetical protein EJB05_46555 [Eragrostis curvula]|uniref:Uncharacterized protein n=1 Tax=Eragrostis curvula TaxID=38414 RepID=A0A5J9TNB2_9POAL|nr:hypothetical protein EJB05_46555 [Eragrostis curvula]
MGRCNGADRPQTPNAGGRHTNASTNGTAISSADKDCELIYCAKRVCDHGVTCYCCIPNPDIRVCYGTMNGCNAHCPGCKTKRS